MRGIGRRGEDTDGERSRSGRSDRRDSDQPPRAGRWLAGGWRGGAADRLRAGRRRPSKPADSRPAGQAGRRAGPPAPAAASGAAQRPHLPTARRQPASRAGRCRRGTPKKGGEYILASRVDANSLEPHNDLTNVRIYVTGLVYDNLISIDQDLKLQPGLAESWTVTPDNLTYTFKLRKGAKFHNGREVTADDVIYTYNRILDPKMNASQKVDLETIETHDRAGPVHPGHQDQDSCSASS